MGNVYFEGSRDIGCKFTHSLLIRKSAGSLAFHNDMDCAAKLDEPGLRFGDRVFKMGEYVPLEEYESDVLPNEKTLRSFPVNLLQCRDDEFSSFFC